MDRGQRADLAKEAREYTCLKVALKSAEHKLSEQKNEVDALRSKMLAAKGSFYKYVGRNIPSRCATVDSFVVTVGLVENGHSVKVFDAEGELVE